jgi:FAD/FMN-containing dehydrogenase
VSDPSLASWGRFPHFPQSAHRVHWRGDLPQALRQVSQEFGTTLAYGSGRSYGDSCLASSDHVLHMGSLDRFIAADWVRGTLVAEAGVTLEQVMRLAVPRGWFPPVVPGTQFVTLGGALANDVHGKNHHVRGTFGRHVLAFGLVRLDRGTLRCSDAENADLFRATIGGLGLTGIIEWVELQLMPIRSAQMNVREVRFGSLQEFLAISNELDASHEYAVAWLDCAARGPASGRGVYSVANHSESGNLEARKRRATRVPVTPSFSVVKGASLRAFNALYYRARKSRSDFTADYGQFLFPLDRVRQWNRLYGARGFQQFQCVLPELAAAEAARELLQVISASRRGSFLAVMKRCGPLRSPGLLSFPLPGITLALDFPQEAELGRTLFPRLDAIVRSAGGRQYPAKDAHMSAEDFRRSYPDWQQVEALRDKALASRFWQRVTAT